VVAGQAGKGDGTREGFNKSEFDVGYKKAFYACNNHSCPKRHNCYRYLKTPTFDLNQECFIARRDGSCSWYIECKTKKDFDKLEN